MASGKSRNNRPIWRAPYSFSSAPRPLRLVCSFRPHDVQVRKVANSSSHELENDDPTQFG